MKDANPASQIGGEAHDWVWSLSDRLYGYSFPPKFWMIGLPTSRSVQFVVPQEGTLLDKHLAIVEPGSSLRADLAYYVCAGDLLGGAHGQGGSVLGNQPR